MAAKAIDKAVAAAILIDWRVGQLSQQQISEKHKDSKDLVVKLSKAGIPVDRDCIYNAKTQQKSNPLLRRKLRQSNGFLLSRCKRQHQNVNFSHTPPTCDKAKIQA